MNGRLVSFNIVLGVLNSCEGILKALLIKNSVNCFGYCYLLKFILRFPKCFVFASVFSAIVQIRRANVLGG